MLPGALAFRSLAERLIGRSLQSATTPEDDTFLLHRQSVVGAEETEIYFDRFSTMAREHPGAGDCLRDLTVAHVERLSRSELEAIVAGYRIPERSVDAHWVAEQFISAIGAETKIELATGRTVVAVRALEKICDPSAIVAGYRIPERSVDAHWVAEQFISAIGAETKIELATGRTVVAVRALEKR